jgi:hypothetical protein
MNASILKYSDDDEDDDPLVIIMAMIAFCIIIEISKEPEYICEHCGRLYKQESRYKTHIEHAHHHPIPQPTTADAIWCIEKDTPTPTLRTISTDNTVVMELLRQNRDMLDMLKKQQDTISLLLNRCKINIE